MTQVQSANLSQNVPGVDPRSRLGDTLKNARMKAGVTIDAVAHETKISKQFIIYLESGNFDQLPGQVFGRGFIKNIARYLRSDANELLRMYDDCWGESKPAGTAEASAEGVERRDTATAAADENFHGRNDSPIVHRLKTSNIPDIKHLPSVNAKKDGIKVPTWFLRGVMSQHTWLSVLGTVAAVMVIGVFGRWVVARMSKGPLVQAVSPIAVPENASSVDNQDTSRQLGEAGEFSVPSGVVAGVEAAVPNNVVEKVIDPNATAIDTLAAQNQNPVVAPGATGNVDSGATAAVSVAANKVPASISEDSPLTVEGSPVAFEQVLDVNISTPVEMRLIVDGKKTDRMSYPAGTTQLTFRDRAELYIYDASAVDITFNGKSLGSLGAKGRKRKIFFQAKPSESDFPH